MSRTSLDRSPQIRRGLLELCTLALLEERPGYGYEIVARLGEASGLEAGEGTIYPLLRRLRKLGWLQTFWRESDSGPPRQYYELTAAGREHLTELTEEWRTLRRSVDRLLLGRARRRPLQAAGDRAGELRGNEQ